MVPAIGYAIREQNRYVLDDLALNAVEITYERADDPLRIERYIGDAHYDYVSVHALKLSLASADAPGAHYLEGIRQLAEENGAVAVSDHLGYTRIGEAGVELGSFELMPLTPAALDITCRNVQRVMDYFCPFQFFIENVAYLERPQGPLAETEFLRRVLERTGCGWLLDVTNVYANSRNFGFDAYDFIAEVMPVASRVQIHLAGGRYDERSGLYLDSHSHPVPAPVFDLFRFALASAHGKVDAAFIERDQNFPEEVGWREEIRQVRDIAETVSALSALEV